MNRRPHMLMESQRWDNLGIANRDYNYKMNEIYSKISHDYNVFEKEKNRSFPTSSLPSAGFAEHPVSGFDTLSGVAIKYGVEVADIKKMNGLVTDRQMFALKSLRIPLPGRHLPSPCLSNGSDTPSCLTILCTQSSANRNRAQHLPPNILDSFQSLRLETTPRRVSPAMSSSQGYNGHIASARKSISEGFEMVIYGKGDAHYKKFRSVNNRFYDETVNIMSAGEAKDAEPDQSNEKLIRRRQKSEAGFTVCTPERLLKEDNSSRGYSTIIAKGLALRSKAVQRSNSGADAEVVEFNATPTGLGDGFVVAEFSVVSKSSSTPSLQDQDSSSFPSLWPTSSKWSLKSDSQAVSTVGIARPIFDGLRKPIFARKNKTALD